jgi:hypothetical protein
MRGALAALAALLLGGCIDIDFDPPHLVKSERILGLRAEPPEVAFGEDVRFEALLVDADGSDLAAQPGVELRWTVCLSLAEVLNAAGLGASAEIEDDCAEGGDDLVVLEQEGLPPNAARLPGETFTRLLTMLPMGGGGEPMLPPGGEQALDPDLLDTLTTVLAEVGVPLRVRLEVFRDGDLLFSGFKRFAITQRAEPTTNPPPPRVRVGEVWLSARDGDPTVCVPEAGAAPRVAPEAEVELDPDDDEEAWLERYPVFGLGNQLQINEESAYYSWFVTGGAMSDDITQRPNDEVTWTAPAEPGPVTLWVVVRDGHLGMSWCRAELTVE